MNQYVGSLQVLLTNEGRKPAQVSKEVIENQGVSRAVHTSLDGRAPAKKSKKVYSKPLAATLPSTSADKQPAASVVPYANEISEDARKQLRIQRLRQQNAQQNLDPSVINQENADSWAKMEALKQI